MEAADVSSRSSLAEQERWCQGWLDAALSTQPADFELADKLAKSIRAEILYGRGVRRSPPPRYVFHVASPEEAIRMIDKYSASRADRYIGFMGHPEVVGKSSDVQMTLNSPQQIKAHSSNKKRPLSTTTAGKFSRVLGTTWSEIRPNGRWGNYASDLWNGHITKGPYGNGWSIAKDRQIWVAELMRAAFLRDCCGCTHPNLAGVERYEKLIMCCGGIIFTKQVLAIIDRPKQLSCDEQGHLHSRTGPALAYRDGSSIYAVHGVQVPELVIRHPAQINARRIEAEFNAEVRRVMIDLFGMERYVRESNADVVSTCPADHSLPGLRSARLLRKSQRGDEPIVMLDMLNSTPEQDGTTKRYLIRIDPRAYDGEASRDCHAALASTYRGAKGKLLFEDFRDYAPMQES